jgi:hypothetical protein
VLAAKAQARSGVEREASAVTSKRQIAHQHNRERKGERERGAGASRSRALPPVGSPLLCRCCHSIPAAQVHTSSRRSVMRA